MNCLPGIKICIDELLNGMRLSFREDKLQRIIMRGGVGERKGDSNRIIFQNESPSNDPNISNRSFISD